MNKNFVHYLVWLIPIRSLRDKIRWKIMKDNIITRNFCYWVNYQTYKDKIKNKKTFFVTKRMAYRRKRILQKLFL